MNRVSFLVIAMVLLLLPDSAWALQDISAVTVKTNPDGSEEYSVTLQILAIMTALTFIPAMVIMMTSFTRIIIVLAILRQAIGLQQSPSNQILIGIALFLSFFIMSPVLNEVNDKALQPYLNEEVTSMEALDRAKAPVKAFMLSQTRLTDLETFIEISGEQGIAEPNDVPMSIFIPFLIIDLVVASVLMAMGMMMLSPMIVSLPFKLMLFVLVDGWSMTMSTLAGSFGV